MLKLDKPVEIKGPTVAGYKWKRSSIDPSGMVHVYDQVDADGQVIGIDEVVVTGRSADKFVGDCKLCAYDCVKTTKKLAGKIEDA